MDFFVSTCRIKIEEIQSGSLQITVKPKEGLCRFSSDGCLEKQSEECNCITLKTVESMPSGCLDINTSYGEAIRLSFRGKELLSGFLVKDSWD